MSDDAYLASYSRTDIHAEMLDDRSRTETYRRALLDLDLTGKTVLDVGAGTGILSLFATQAGAAHVYAVEASALAEVTQQIVDANGLGDRITVLRQKAEDIELPGPVDVIVSEWMGYFLLFERMFDSVVVARDRWLAPGGRMLPGTATLLLAGIEDFEYASRRFGWWDDVYGFDLTPMVSRCLSEAVVERVDERHVLTDLVKVLELDLLTAKADDQDFEATFELRVNRTDHLHAIMGAFDVTFNEDGDELVLATDPFSEGTHWKQTIFYLERPLSVKKGDVIEGSIRVVRHPDNPRGLEVVLHLATDDEERSGTYQV
ncbi:MAG: 50S ribosomal protein L11 methyltransferase [Myxococcales bacterium]|nr:50S ribosomal protein L11 methyltransferase [Myxococcales bacterium]